MLMTVNECLHHLMTQDSCMVAELNLGLVAFDDELFLQVGNL